MRVWRLVGGAFADTAFDGEGAARYGGRWNDRGVRMVYAADSLALATLELAVHLGGARVEYVAIEVQLPDADVTEMPARRRRVPTRDDPAVSRRAGTTWAASNTSLALAVPSVVVDARSGERNVLINPQHQSIGSLLEVQRFGVVIDERLR